ncbi:hypothetical protein FGG08_003322 [Glutinoglossum americanum]|uniref:EXS-domain-containing protein n=1 Tax=Glutinoglossum americanum TaxID=1670608 RepID=A0A9P8L4W0_9PEZI|nr:hypothetical protein FGG08_003322 [Glutinoglossum americanum]
MKFAKELEQELIPEWRAKYFDYRHGKKKLKALERALRDAYGSPRSLTGAFRGGASIRRHTSPKKPGISPKPPREAAAPEETSRPEVDPTNGDNRMGHQKTAPIVLPERQRLRRPSPDNDPRMTVYGSIVATPPRSPSPLPPALELPDPAMDPADRSSIFRMPLFGRVTSISGRSDAATNINPPALEPNRSVNLRFSETHSPLESEPKPSPQQRTLQIHQRIMSLPGGSRFPVRSLLGHTFPIGGSPSNKNMPGATTTSGDIPLEIRRNFDIRHAQFLRWMDDELEKIETFHKMKETEATERLQVLRAQLHEMRDRRMEEVIAAQRAKEKSQEDDTLSGNAEGGSSGSENIHSEAHASGWLKPVESALDVARGRLGRNPGKATRAMQALGTPETPTAADCAQHARVDSHRDFTRRKTSESIPYHQAKRKLKRALQEYYRSLELLKSYALLNRTAFRKMNKKYDKVLNARPAGRYMSEKVNRAYFVQSEIPDAHIAAVEDLYARYFERGSHKIAAGKLRSTSRKPTEYYGSVYRNGLLIGAGLVFGIQGLISGAVKLSDPNQVVRVNTSYLLQIYAGLFLSVLLFLSFVLNCKIWTEAKINYVFIFEFDTRHHLDWHQLAEGLVLFFCLYGRSWNDPGQCNSSHSRLLGFFTTLPGIWRGLHCIRRYYDTGNVFPHLVNGGKYTFTILYYVTLSLYRIHKLPQIKALFITCAGINAIYCSIWDLLMDWSLGNPYAHYPFLRDVLGFKHVWIYYAAMVLDPILRFNWIFYAIFASDNQHSALLSFIVSLSEVLRRGMWSLFRMENEHCTNVGRFRAYRDIPLPYSLPASRGTSLDSRSSLEGSKPSRTSSMKQPKQQPRRKSSPPPPPPSAATSAATTATAPMPIPDLEHAHRRPTITLRRHASSFQGGMARVGTAISMAHAQDFERRKRPIGGELGEGPMDGESSEEEDEEEEMEMVEEGKRAVRGEESKSR